MAFIPVPNVGQFAMNFLLNGQRAVNVFHLEFVAPPTSGDLNAGCQMLRDWWDIELQAEVTNQASLELITARDLTVQNGVGVVYTDGLPLSGGAAVAALPSNVTIAVKWGTGLAGRSYRGRTYHVGLGESQVDGNTLNSTTRTFYTAAYASLISRADIAGAQLVVVSRQANLAPRTTGVTTPITSASIEPTVDTQRRRLVS